MAELEKTVSLAWVHSRKEIENYLLVPGALERAVNGAVIDRARRLNESPPAVGDIRAILAAITDQYKNTVQAQYVGRRVEYARKAGTTKDDSTLVAEALVEFENRWIDLDERLLIVPGKDALTDLRQQIQDRYQVTLTDYRIISAYKAADVPSDLHDLVVELDTFRRSST